MAKPKPTFPAKTACPRLTAVFPRKRLFRLLDRDWSRPILWMSGPPGSGKTTLVASYLEARKFHALWYQMDEGDTDVATFFYYMGLAIKRAAPRKRTPMPLLTPECWRQLSFFTRQYFRELYGRLRSPFVVVFDNYQDVPVSSRLHDVICDGLSEIPEGGKVIVVSRGDAPPGLTRLRASQAMGILGWDTLRLTAAEASGIARLQGKRTLTRETIRHLHDKTAGWAAGFVLMLEQAEAEGFMPQSLDEDTPETIFDYFASEIFHKEAPETQHFLLKTAFLTRMTARMALELTGLRQASHLLSDLHRRNYFTEKRVHPAPVYQYHPLFRAFLLTCAKETLAPTELVRVQRRAAALLAEAGQAEDAVGLLRAAGDWEGFSQVLLRQAPALAVQGRTRTLREWIGSLPPAMVEQSAWLQYWLGMCLLSFRPAQSREPFERAFGLFKRHQDPIGLFQAWCRVVSTFLYELDDFTPLDRWIDELEALLRVSSSFPSVEIETQVANAMFGALLFRQPQHPALPIWAECAFTLSQRHPGSNRLTTTGLLLMHYHLWMGDLAKATVVIDTLREAMRPQQAAPLNLLAWRVAEASYHWYVAAPEACLQAVAAGLETAHTTGIHILDSQLLGSGVYAALSSGDLTTGRALLQKLAAMLDRDRALDFTHYHMLRAWEAVLYGNLPLALQYAETGVELKSGMPMPDAQSRILLAQILHEHGAYRQAAAHLAQARQIGRRVHSRMLEYMGLLTEAQFALALGKEAQGLKFLRQALALGREQGYVNTPWWRPSVMARLCVKALEAGIEVAYVKDLARRRGLVPDTPPLDIEDWPWTLQVYTLGEFRLVQEGKPVHFSGKVQQRPLAMLKALIAFGGRDVPEVLLADALWPEAEGDLAHRSFATTLHRLRQLVGQKEVILMQGGQVRLDPRHCWVDTWAFERLLEQADTMESQDRIDQALELVDRALPLYHGAFLEREQDAPWAFSLRERLRSKFLRYTVKVGRHWEQAGEWQRAIDCYEKGLDVDDLAEAFYQRLLACYQRLGRRAEALAVYQRCCKTLAVTLGVAPSLETQALYRSLRAE